MSTQAYLDPELLWTPERLRSSLDDPDIRVVDVRFGEAFASGHVPGACHFSVYGINTYDTDDAPLRSFTHMWAFLLGLRGVRADHTIVVYGDQTDMSAARAFWFLEYLGHDDVHVLDGGFDAWKAAGLPVAHDGAVPKAASFEYTARRERVATYQDVIDAIDSPRHVILDTRSRKEWNGTDKRAARNGAVPSSVHLEWLEHLTPDGRMKPAPELRALFEARGVTPDRTVIALCNTGYRSAHAYLALRLLGYPNVRNYVGSWQEWGNRDGCPVVVPQEGV
ncbi:MAG: sulfurtransferase [Ectothiorhodospiraceae bacterium]|nr:sulfurtransferase [Chromatiales bacterium]MCP5156345.1 sulfurtransferase [Ectothiorhodospiraceae bacterium]